MTSDDDECDDDCRALVFLDFVGDALDPAMLLPLVPLTPLRPKRKGDPLGRPLNGRVPVAKTGYCGFSSSDLIQSADGNDLVTIMLRAVEPRIEDIRRVVAESGLRWKLVFFEGNLAGHRFADLKPELFAWAERLGLPLILGVDSNIAVPANRTGSGTGRD